MAFVNEYVSEEDIEKYKLDDLWNRYNRYETIRMPERRLEGINRYSWTIDRERNIALIMIDNVGSVEHTDRPVATNEFIFILFYKEEKIEIHLFKSPQSSPNFKYSPYEIIWDLGKIIPNHYSEKQLKKIITILKEALIVYGFRGIRLQVDKTVVKFNF